MDIEPFTYSTTQTSNRPCILGGVVGDSLIEGRARGSVDCGSLAQGSHRICGSFWAEGSR